MKTAEHSTTLAASDEATLLPSADPLVSAEAQFLTALGRRVREFREQRGLTRKLLAQQANVSERYLGQLESGDGNVSIVLLRRIAAALTVTLRDILPDEHEGARVRQQRVALIGLRGAGKATLGSMLATALSMPFVELDREIEREAGLPVSEIFTLYGQAGYRRTEQRCLRRVLAEYDRAVIAVGGGIVSEEETFQLLLRHCHTVWLKAAPEEHMARVIAQGDFRPMAGNAEAMQDLKHILTAREPLYRKADTIVDTSGQTPEESFAVLQQLVRGKESVTRRA